MSAEVENAIDIALKVAAALQAVGAEYFVGGSLASSLQGEPRATNDIDFVISLPVGRINALGDEFEVDTDMLRDAVLHARSANAFYLPVITKIDFFGRGYEPFDESEFSRRSSAIVGGTGSPSESPKRARSSRQATLAKHSKRCARPWSIRRPR
jgi:hypothetical protein